MPTGPEMLMRALGINPDEIKAAIMDTVNGIRGGLKSLDDRLKSIEETQAQINARLARMEHEMFEECTHTNGAIAVLTVDREQEPNV